MIIDPAVFAPDLPALVGTTDRVFNVVPRTQKSYGPMRSLLPHSEPIASRVQGAASAQDKFGAGSVFAGDAAKLYRLAGGTAFVDVSRPAGYTVGEAENVRFAQYGERVISTNFTDPMQSFLMGSSAVFSDLVTSGVTSLRARYLGIVKEWVVYLNTNDATDGLRPQRVWWGAIDDPTTVPTPGSSEAREKQSDFQDVLVASGAGRGVVGGLAQADAILIFERSVSRMDYVGPPAIFSIKTIDGARGTSAPNSVIRRSGACYYLAEDGFVRCDGAVATPIGIEKVNSFFFGDVNLDALHLVSGASDPVLPLLFWAYPRAGVNYCNRVLVYNEVLDRWTVTDVDSVICRMLLQTVTLGLTLDAMPGFLDDYAQTWDDRQFADGRQILGAFGVDNRLGFFSGPNLAATIETGDASLVDGWVSRVTGTRPLVDSGEPSVRLGVRYDARSPLSFLTPTTPDTAGFCPAYAQGRYHRARVELPAGSNWTHFRGLEVPKEYVQRISRR